MRANFAANWQVSLKKEEERDKLVFGWKIEDVANIWITGREIFLSKQLVSRNENSASICKFESKTFNSEPRCATSFIA